MVRKFSVILLGIVCLLAIADLASARGGGRRGGGGYGGCDGGYGGYGGGYYGQRAYSDGFYGGYPYAMGDSWWGRSGSSFYFSPDSGTAQVRVIVPDPNASVMFNGQPTQQMGNERLFFTPPLQAGPGNLYRVRATWRQGGKDITQERTIDVNPGSTMTVDFTRAASEALPDQGRPGSEPVPQVQNLQGRIIRTGTDNFVLTTSDNREVTIYTNPQTRYLMNNNPAVFTDARVGTNINLGYTMQGTRYIANSVTITAAK